MKIIAIYSGRFQPFALHHAKTFEWVQNKFGKENSFIGTSNKVDYPDSPLSFTFKKRIIEKYGFDAKRIKNSYIAEEIIKQYDPKETAVVFVIGEKDAKRLKPGKFLLNWDGDPKFGWDEHTYILVAPHVNEKFSNSADIRRLLGDPLVRSKRKIFKEAFGFEDEKIYNMLIRKCKYHPINEIID